jgi:hypothetical protein
VQRHAALVLDLEAEAAEGRILARDARLAGLVERDHRGLVERRRQVAADRVEQPIHAAVLERRAAEHGHHAARQAGLAQRTVEPRRLDRCAGDVVREDRLVLLGQHLDQLALRLGDHLAVQGRLGTAVVLERAPHDVDEPDEPVAFAHGQHDRDRA